MPQPAGPLAALRHYEDLVSNKKGAPLKETVASGCGNCAGSETGIGHYPLVADVRSIRYLQDGSLTAKVFSLAPDERRFVSIEPERLEELLGRWGLGFPPEVRNTFVLLLDPHVKLP
eukprot:SAG31_NODE_21958_length_537_cov_0.815068_1_plen_116_part_10